MKYFDPRTKIVLTCNEKVINEYSQDHVGWNNPIDFIPEVGTCLEMVTYEDKRKKEGGKVSVYRVDAVKFICEESTNHQYSKTCEIMLSLEYWYAV